MRNLMALLLAARGTPLLLAGDEMARTQKGNNNAYCQNNAVSWVDWSLLETNQALWRFVQGLIALRKQHTTLRQVCALNGRAFDEALCEGVTFHGVTLEQPDWSHFSHSLAVQFHAATDDVGFYLLANAYHQPLAFALPPKVRWARLVDSALPPPHDLEMEEDAPLHEGNSYLVQPNSVVLLIERS